MGVPQHPYLNLSVSDLRFWSIVATIAFALATVVFVIAIPVPHLSLVADFVRSDSVNAQVALDHWGSEIREAFRFMLGFDFLYDLVHNNLVALLAAWGAVRVGRYWALAVACVVAWTLWLDSAFNVAENLAYVRVLSTNNVEPWHFYASTIFRFRTATLFGSALAALVLHTYAFGKRRVA